MSKYHPLDVRHPNNRARESKTYLLDPPSPVTQTRSRMPRRSTSATPEPTATATTGTLSRAARAVAQSGRFATPWGQSQPGSSRPASASSQTPARRSRFNLGRIIFFGVVLLVIARNGGFEALGDMLSDLFGEAQRIVR
jgi:hypothetical protein